MNKIAIVILFGTFFLHFVFAQRDQVMAINDLYNEANRLYDLEEPTNRTDSIALQLFLKTAEKAKGIDYGILTDCLIKAGNIHQGYKRFSEANNLYHRALTINDKKLKNPAVAYEAYLYLGSSLYFSNIIDSAQHYFEEASGIALNYSGNLNLPEQNRLYNSLGAIYYESANYLQAKNYFERALEFSPKDADGYIEMYNGIQSNIASCLMKLNLYDSALQILQSLSLVEQQKYIIRQNTAHSYFELGKYDSALMIYQSLPLQNDFNSVVALTDMGRIYLKRQQWQQAEIVFDSAIALNKRISTKIKNKEEALAYLYRSQLADQQGLTDEAITWINEALQEVHLNFTWSKPADLPADVSQTVSPITLFSILHEKAKLFYKKYNRTYETALLDASLSSYTKAIETANFIKLNFDNDEAKHFFNENYRPIYNEALKVAFEAVNKDDEKLDDYIFILENFKGNILYQNLQNVLLKSTAKIPDSIRRREKDIKQLLAFYTSRINQSAEEEVAVQLQKRLRSLQVELSRIQKNYEQDASYNLYKYQLADKKINLAEIQSGLDGNTALINYYTADSAIYCLVINKTTFQLEKINTDSIFYKTFRSFTDAVYHYEEGKRYEGYTASAELYKKLISPIKKVAGSSDNWVIIPDGKLYYLPFEALVEHEKKRDYLMLSKIISYHYSFGLLFGSKTHHYSSPVDKGAVGFAPYSRKDEKTVSSGLAELPLSGQELKELTANIFAGEDASKKQFLAQMARYPVIHLATHASTGKDSSSNWIQFYPADSLELNHKLFVHEIYNLDLHQAELVVLSACETGGGVSASGEGLLSLSRAFIYAGADGIISTLWKTEDRVTSFLMQRMHVHLKQKVSPEKALQLAKKELLTDKTLGAQYKTPDYWANFIYVGKLHPKPVHIHWWIWLISGLTLIGMSSFFIWPKKKKSPPRMV